MKYVDRSNLDKIMESYSYTYDKNNNIISKTTVNNYPKNNSDKINETKEYTYDNLGRLTKTNITDKSTNKKSTVTYEYDLVGNRTSMTKDGATTSYTYNDLNQLTKSTENKDGKQTSNNPINYTDPSGHLKKSFFNKVTTVGVAISAVLKIFCGIKANMAREALRKKLNIKVDMQY